MKNCHHYNTMLSLHIISRHYKKSLLRSKIYHGYEELSTDTNYPFWRRQQWRSKYVVQFASWQLRSNSPKKSVCHTFLTMFPSSYHHEIFRRLSPRTRVRSMQKVKVTTQLNRFRTVTQVWIHIWWWNDAYSLMMLRRGALFFKVIRQISRSHGSKKRQIWPRLVVSRLFEFTNGYEMMHKAWRSMEKVPYCISKSHGSKKRQIWPRLGVSGL